MQVSAPSALSRLAVGAKQLRQFLKQVRFRAEVAEVVVAVFNLLGHLLLHLRAVVTVKAIALEKRSCHALPAKNLLESAHHRRRTGARRSGNRNNRVLDGHGSLPDQIAARNKPRIPKSGASYSRTLWSRCCCSRRSTSTREPKMNAMRWCNSSGTISSTRSRPVLARPSACSTMNAIGFAS